MAITFFPHIVVEISTGKTFRQSRTRDAFGQHTYRRARRLAPGVWLTYRNAFTNYSNVYESYKTGTPKTPRPR